MHFSDRFRDVVIEQSGYFTVEQASRLNGTSRKYLSRLSNNDLEVENVEHGIYRVKLIEESPHSDLIIMGLKAGKKAAISHKSALSYWDMSDEIPYNIYMKAFDNYLKKDLRSCKDIILSTKGEKLKSDDINDYYNLGEIYITTPTRTLFDCVMDECIQIESIQECIDSGKFNKYKLSDKHLDMWENNPTIISLKEKSEAKKRLNKS